MNINEIIQEEDGLSNSINELAWSRLMGKFNKKDYLQYDDGSDSMSIDEDKLFAFFKKYCTPNIEAITNKKPIEEASQATLLTVSELGPLLLNNPLLVDADKSVIKRLALQIMADGNILTEDKLNKLINVYLSRQKSN